MYTLEQARLIELKAHTTNGSLVVAEAEREIPFDVKRIFHVQNVADDSLRGDHAHRSCKQAFQCLRGTCEVILDDGRHKRTVVLNRPTQLLYVPETIWASERYISPDTILLVYCNERYRMEDYIRDYQEFLIFRGAAK